MNLKHIIVLAMLGLAACSEKPEATRHTVEEYRADGVLREDTLAQCANDPGTLGQTPDCINAQRAARLESHGSLRDSKPIGLNANKAH